jgi:spore coat protein U-like protein
MKRLMIFLVFLLLCGARLGAQSCQLSGTTQVSFGTYSGATLQTTGGVSVNCTSGVAYNIELSAGYSGSATNREMDCSSCTPQTLGYQLFSNASYTTNWGNTPSTDLSATGTGSNQNFTIYAQIPALEAFYASGSGSNYTDNLIVTIVCNSCTSISGNNQGLNVHLQQTAVGCGISASNLNFGNYTGTVLNATTTLQVGCTSGTAYNVGLNAGTATGATVTTRAMQNGTALLNYALYSNSGRTTNWGNTVGTDTVAGTGTGVAQPLTVYGQIAAGLHPTPGTYTDTITAAVTY